MTDRNIYECSSIKENIMTIYRINLKDSWYRQITSIDALVEKILNRWYDKYYMQGLKCPLSRVREEDKESWLRINNYITEPTKCEIVYKDFNSAQDFYYFIGYDNKNKSVKQLDRLIEEHNEK